MGTMDNSTLNNKIYRNVCEHYKSKDWKIEDIKSFKEAINKTSGEIESIQELLLYLLSLKKEEVEQLIQKLDQECSLYLFEERVNINLKTIKGVKDKKPMFEIHTKEFETGDIVETCRRIQRKIPSIGRNLQEFYKEIPSWFFQDRKSVLKPIYIDFENTEVVRERIKEYLKREFPTLDSLPINGYLTVLEEQILIYVSTKMKQKYDQYNDYLKTQINRYHNDVIKASYIKRIRREQVNQSAKMK